MPIKKVERHPILIKKVEQHPKIVLSYLKNKLAQKNNVLLPTHSQNVVKMSACTYPITNKTFFSGTPNFKVTVADIRSWTSVYPPNYKLLNTPGSDKEE